MIRWLAEVPTTNLRVVFTLVLAGLTGIRVLFWSWEPNIEWLAFLSLWAGLDVTQYIGKRATYQAPPPSPDREDAPAMAGNVLTRDGAELAARHYAGEVG